MTAIASLFEPLVIRWINRNTCHFCGAPATRKCCTHSTRICESSHCKMTHRRLKAAVSGDLTKPRCDYADLVGWKTHLLHSVVALAVGSLVVVGLLAL